MAQRKFNRLTVKKITGKLAPGYHRDGGGLCLQVSDASTKSWVFEYMLNGKKREMGLGALGPPPHFTISLSAARERAAECRRLLVDRIDPIEHRKAQRQRQAQAADSVKTFSWCAAQLVKTMRKGWTNERHAEQWAQTLKDYAEPVFGSLPVHEVATAHVMRALEPIWTEIPPTARRVRARIERVLDWAKAHGYRSGDNPARWRDHLKNLLSEHPKKHVAVKHHPAMPYADVADFLTELRQRVGMMPRALEVTIFTALRTREVLGAKWDEFDLEAGIWTVPAARIAKTGRPHRVPLAPPVVALLAELKRERRNEYVFPGRKGSLTRSAMHTLLVTDMKRDVTVHGFRSTFRDWAGECTNYPREVCEMALSHAVGNDVEQAYARGDLFEKRRRLMNDWAKFCETTKRGDVVPIRAGKGASK